MVPRRPEGILSHYPALRKYHKVDVGGAGHRGGRRQHREDRGIGMVEAHRVHRAEALEVVLVGRVVAVPGDHVERRLVELAGMEAAAPLHRQARRLLAVLRSEEHTSELQSLMRISYAVFCLKKKIHRTA